MFNDSVVGLTDYQDHFGSKYDAIPYNSGMDLKKLSEHFNKFGLEIKFINFADVLSYDNEFWKGRIIIYTSAEDLNYHYKDYIEDVVLYISLCGGVVIPSYYLLRANNNKVFMELFRKTMNLDPDGDFTTNIFGTFEELEKTSRIRSSF